MPHRQDDNSTPECWACVPTNAETSGDTLTITHEPGCQHIAEQRARFQAATSRAATHAHALRLGEVVA